MTEGVDRAIEALRLAAGCVSDHRLLLGPGRTERVVEYRTPAPLTGTGVLHGAMLDLSIILRDAGVGQSPTVSGYLYALLDHSGREHLAFHWHPSSVRSLATFPHFHVSAALRSVALSGQSNLLSLDKTHIPTGHLPVATIIRFLVADLGIRPRMAGWEDRLEGARQWLPAAPADSS